MSADGPRRQSTILLVAVCVAVALTAGCGTTVTGAEALGPNDQGLLPQSAPTSTGTRPGPPADRETVPAVVQSPGQAWRPDPNGVDVPAAGQSSGSPFANGPGVTSSVVYLGLNYVVNQTAAGGALGAGGIETGDQRTYYNAVIRNINEHGGIRGHRIVPLYFGVDPTSTQTVDQQSQAACDYWTHDNKVLAIVGLSGKVLRQCAKAAGALHLLDEWGTASEQVLRENPHYLEVSALAQSRVGRVTVEGLARTDYFAAKPKIGIVTWDDDGYRFGLRSSWLPALAAHGIAGDRVTTEFIPPPQSLAGVSQSARAVSSAVLKLRGANIDHVIIADGPAGVLDGTGLTLLFLENARPQKYLPRYGLNTTNSPQSGLDAGLWTADDVRRSVAVEWVAHADDRRSAPIADCLRVMSRAGVTMDGGNAEGSALIACDLLFFLRAAITAGPGPITPDAAITGLTRLASTYASPLTFGPTFFSSTRRDGVSTARLAKLDDACDCYRWQGPQYPIS